VLIDLGRSAADAVHAIRESEGRGHHRHRYVDHTREDVMAAARAACCDQVMSRVSSRDGCRAARRI